MGGGFPMELPQAAFLQVYLPLHVALVKYNPAQLPQRARVSRGDAEMSEDFTEGADWSVRSFGRRELFGTAEVDWR